MEDKQSMKNLKIVKRKHDRENCCLCKIIDNQDKFNIKFFDQTKMNIHDRVTWSLKLFTALSLELAEMINWLPWKWWKTYKGQPNTKEIKFELIDCLIFLLSLMRIWGMSCEEINSYYYAKNEENHRRQQKGYNATL